MVSSTFSSARNLAGALFFVVLSGCALIVPQTAALRDAWPTDIPDRVELVDVPFFPQSDYQCGPAALATAMAAYGVAVTADSLVGQVYIPARQGSLQLEMLAAPRQYGMVSYELAPRIDDVLREVAAGNPVVVLQNYGSWPFHIWHYAVVAGYDRDTGEVALRSGVKRRLLMPFPIFEYVWKNAGHWAFVVVPPPRLPATATESRYLQAIVAMERTGSARAARAAYESALARWPDNIAAATGLATAHHALGELEESERVLRSALVEHPDAPVLLNNLAQTLADRGRAGEALETIERALPVAGPFAGAIQETYDAILLKLRDGSGTAPVADPAAEGVPQEP